MKLITSILLTALLTGCAALLPPTESPVDDLWAGMSQAEAAAVLGCDVPPHDANPTGYNEHTWRCRSDRGELMLRFVGDRLQTVYQ